MSHANDAFYRRDLLRASAALGASLAVGAAASPAPAAAATLPDFPPEVELCREAYENWAGEIRLNEVWVCAPRSPEEVVAVVNWAYEHGWTVRPRGYRHGWAPLTVTAQPGASTTTLLVDTTRHLTDVTVVSTEPGAVRAQTGASMEALLRRLEDAGLGLTNTPAPGDISVGGALAIGAHGTSVPATGEVLPPGHTYGSLSNLVLSLTAVVWSADAGRYVLRTISRADPACKAFLAHLGRAFLTEVTLRVGPDYNLRCVSRVDLSVAELFAPPGAGAAHSFTNLLAGAGRGEIIWFAFTDRPWVKLWSLSPQRPLLSRPVVAPYNYPFADNIPEPVSDLAEQLLGGAWQLTPTFGQVQYTGAAAGLLATLSSDLWGRSKNLLLYVKPTTLRETANGYAVHTSRASLQRVLHEFATFYQALLAAYQARGLFPVTGQVEIRVSGVDRAADVGLPGAEPPALSATRPRADHPEWDTVVWFNVLTFPSAPGAHAFYRELEAFFFGNYVDPYAAVRVEWSKGWAYTNDAAWADPLALGQTIPDSFRQGPDPTFDGAVATLDAHDPHRIFSNAFLDELLP
jgi:FAD/FMN-containing dehydrogenase